VLTVTVQDGTVDLWGLVHSVEEKKAAQLAAETTPGVRAVVNWPPTLLARADEVIE
jgi:osmotically-inducible protein OsmY